jgi:hypothetical protein
LNESDDFEYRAESEFQDFATQEVLFAANNFRNDPPTLLYL